LILRQRKRPQAKESKQVPLQAGKDRKQTLPWSLQEARTLHTLTLAHETCARLLSSSTEKEFCVVKLLRLGRFVTTQHCFRNWGKPMPSSLQAERVFMPSLSMNPTSQSLTLGAHPSGEPGSKELGRILHGLPWPAEASQRLMNESVQQDGEDFLTFG
jgi:hypothetical protein